MPVHGEQRATTLQSCVGQPAQELRRSEYHCLAIVQEEGEEKGKVSSRILFPCHLNGRVSPELPGSLT